MARRQYTEDDKAVALATLDVCKGNFLQAAKQANVPRRTLQHWAKGEGVPDVVREDAHTKKADLAARLEDLAHKAIDMAPDAMQDAGFKDLMTGVGIAVDKMQVLRGEPNSITQSSLSDGDRALRVAELLERARARRTGQPPELPADPPALPE